MEGGVCIKTSKNRNLGSELYNDYSVEKAMTGKTTFKEHKHVSLSNGLSHVEAIINAIASKLISQSSTKFKTKLADITFVFLKKLSVTYNSLEASKKKTAVAKRYLDRCDSFAKKANFIGAIIIEPVRLILAALIIAFCAGSIINASSYDVVLGVYANGNLVGYVESKSPMSTALSSIESDLTSIVGSEYKINCDIDYSFLNVKDAKFLNDADCYRILYNIASSDLVDAYALYVDGSFVAAGADFDTLNTLLKKLTGETGNSSIKNDVKIANQLCLKSTVLSSEELSSMFNLITQEAVKSEINAIVQSDRIEVAAESTELESGIPRFSDGINKLLVPKSLADGTKITADKEELLHELDLVYVKTETINEAIPYETTYIESADYYVGTQMLKTGGREGSADSVYEIEYDKNGEISRKLISREVLREPVTEVIVIGTSSAPTVNPSGNLIWPTDMWRGISSNYGGRQLFGSYDFHLGVDIINNYGKDIWAADSGVVTYAGYNNSYGYYVTIEHADGMSTLYAHMSKIYTTKGAEVKQGDVIGAIGKTGVATAYHVHFEVRIDSKTVDPIDYLPPIE